MDFAKLLNLNYIFVSNPAPFHPLQRGIIISVCGLLVLVAFIVWFWGRGSKRDLVSKKVANRIFTYGLVIGILGWLLFFIREQGIYFFSRRFWFLFWFIGAVVWLGYLLKYIFRVAPIERRNLRDKEEFEKYLPGKRSKR